MKLNLLPPTMREKQRYIVIRIISDAPVPYTDFTKALQKLCTQLFGEVTTATMKLWVIKNLYDAENGKAVVKVQHGYVEMLRFCISMVRHIEKQPVVLAVEGVTGTVKSAQNKYGVPQQS